MAFDHIKAVVSGNTEFYNDGDREKEFIDQLIHDPPNKILIVSIQ